MQDLCRVLYATSELVTQCLRLDPDDHSLAQELLQHLWEDALQPMVLKSGLIV